MTRRPSLTRLAARRRLKAGRVEAQRDLPVRRLTVLICLLTVMDMATYSAAVPLIPHFRQQFHLTSLQAGLVLAAYSVAVLIAAVPTGHLADRFGAKRMTAIGACTMLASTAGFATANSFELLVVSRLMQGAGDAVIWSAGVAWVMGRTPASRRGRAIGAIQASGMLGIILGPSIGGVGAGVLGITPTFLLLTAILGVLLAWVLLEPESAIAAEQGQFVVSLRTSLGDSLILAGIVVMFAVSVVGGALQLLVPTRLAVDGMSQSDIGVVYTLGALVGSGVAVVAGPIGDRIGRVPLSIFGTGALAAAVGLLSLQWSVRSFAIIVIGVAGVQALLYTAGYPLGSDGADRAGLGHGVVMGILNLAWGMGAVIGPIAASQLPGLTGARPAYGVLALVTLTAAILVHVLGRVNPARATGDVARP
jgi:MFS family permease